MTEILWSGERAWMRSPLFTLAVLVVVALSLAGSHLLAGSTAEQAWGYDFDAFHTGATMTVKGRLAEAYDPVVFQAALYGSEDMYWMYPPHGAMLLAPLGLLPYGAAAGLLLAALIAVTLLVGRSAFGDLRGGNALLVASAPSLFALLLGQAAPLFGTLLVAALLVAPRRPILAGVLLALLTIKPQYGLLAPLFLLLRGDVRTILSATLATLALGALSVLVLGLDAWSAWLAASDGPARDFIYQNRFASMPSAYQYARFWGVSASVAMGVQVAVIGVCAALLILARRLPYRRHAALALLLACAAMPYLWFYDWLPVMAVALMAWRAEDRLGVPSALLWLLWLVPFASQGTEGLLDAEGAYAASLALIQAVNLAEIAAVWGTALALAYPAIRTTALPVLAPLKRPMKASGPLSSPS